MSVHDCPYCECVPPERMVHVSCSVCGRPMTIEPWYGDWHRNVCSESCEREADYEDGRAHRQRDRERRIERYRQLQEAGQPVCHAVTREGTPCNAPPIHAAPFCNAHADDAIKFARDYGRVLAEMAVDEDLAVLIVPASEWRRVTTSARRRAVDRERDRIASMPDEWPV